MLMSGNSKEPVSLYWHIPFCSHKCGYCHFYVLPDKDALKDELLRGFALEWQRVSPLLYNKEIVSIYFGGGTPALFGPQRIATVLSWIDTLAEQCEITLEANPDEATPELLKAYAGVGINRLSVGVQSLDNALLKTLTRRHDARQAITVIEHAAKHFGNITIDLMYDLPGQSLEAWEHTLAQAIQLPINHLSLYNLTIEPHTQFFRDHERLKPLIPNSEISQRMYELAIDELNAAGLKQYEVSAFARPSFQSRHNSGYWTGRSFYGFGPSAFSYWHARRFRNIANQRRYVDLLSKGDSPVDFDEQLTPAAQRRELLVIQLRLLDGVDLTQFGVLEEETLSTIRELSQHGLLIEQHGRLRLTERGRLCYDTVATELI